MIGTQFPLQYSAGFNYHFTPALSARFQAGLVTKPYDRFILRMMEWYGLNHTLSRTIENSLQVGSMFSAGTNYHFGKNYAGIYGQFAHLKGQTSLAEVLETYLNRDIPFLGINIPLLELSARSNLYNIGIVYGRRFVLPNPRFEIYTEAGIAKIISSGNRFSSSSDLLERLGVVQQLYSNLDNDFRSAYRRYGYLPSVSVYLVYKFGNSTNTYQ
jgi:hypothetical protein